MSVNKKEITYRVIAAFKEIILQEKAKNISEICRKVGYQRSNYQQLEIGERSAPLNLIFELINQYDINPYWIIKGSEPIILVDPSMERPADSFMEKIQILEKYNRSLLDTIEIQKQLITELRRG